MVLEIYDIHVLIDLLLSISLWKWTQVVYTVEPLYDGHLCNTVTLLKLKCIPTAKISSTQWPVNQRLMNSVCSKTSLLLQRAHEKLDLYHPSLVSASSLFGSCFDIFFIVTYLYQCYDKQFFSNNLLSPPPPQKKAGVVLHP